MKQKIYRFLAVLLVCTMVVCNNSAVAWAVDGETVSEIVSEELSEETLNENLGSSEVVLNEESATSVEKGVLENRESSEVDTLEETIKETIEEKTTTGGGYIC